MKLSDSTKRAIKSYGEDKCKEVFLRMSKGEGSISVGKDLKLTGRQVIAACQAGYELSERDNAQQTAAEAHSAPPIAALVREGHDATEPPVAAPIEPDVMLLGDSFSDLSHLPTEAVTEQPASLLGQPLNDDNGGNGGVIDPFVIQDGKPAPVAFVSMRDIMMSRLKQADKKQAIFIIECTSVNQAHTVARNAKRRGDMENILVDIGSEPPKYSDALYSVTRRHVNELGTRWTEK
jgi:hypothetical protein